MTVREKAELIVKDIKKEQGTNPVVIFGSITKLMGFRIPHIINSAHINEF